jgi:thiosulfate/3-mercaptopyruvate sulfurtransferase
VILSVAEHGLPSVTWSSLIQHQGLAIDTRMSAPFNGWRGVDGTPGGHEPGAISLSARWLNGLGDERCAGLLREKRLATSRPYGLYGQPTDVAQLASQLRLHGFRHLFHLTDALSVPDRLVKLPHHRQLVSAAWLSDLVAGRRVEASPDADYRLFEVGWRRPKLFLDGHIAGAGYIDTDSIDVGPIWRARDDESLQETFLEHGITAQTTVILYSRDTIGAARVAHILMYAGVQDVRLLDGGWYAWCAHGGEVQTGAPPVFEPAESFGAAFPGRPELVLDQEQVRSLLAHPLRNNIVSVRAWPEFVGLTSGYSDIEAKGEIAGATWGHAGTDSTHMEHYRNPDNTMRSADEISSFWREWGVVPEKKNVFYCGTGWRASEAFFYAHVMGWTDIAVYGGGWMDWSSNPRNLVTAACSPSR